jgi:hypothetical protein
MAEQEVRAVAHSAAGRMAAVEEVGTVHTHFLDMDYIRYCHGYCALGSAVRRTDVGFAESKVRS